MALQNCFYAGKTVSLRRIYVTQLPGGQKDRSPSHPPPVRTPTEEFAPLASVFQRRFLVGVGSASLVALGSNFVGVTSFLLGLSPQTGRNLKLDVLYPVEGYSRCLEIDKGFEFIYPASWVGDQTLLYRAAGKAESERSLDPPPLNDKNSINRHRGNSISEPIIAFGPPGSNGELNVSVIVSPVPRDFTIEAFGGPKEVGEAVIRTITESKRQANVKAILIESTVKEDPIKKLNYYKLEFRVESPTFHRHNVAICCARGGRLFTLNAQAPELVWSTVKQQFYTIADSFNLTS